MRDVWGSLGFRNVFVQGALHAFRPREIRKDLDQMALACANGATLWETVLLVRA